MFLSLFPVTVDDAAAPGLDAGSEVYDDTTGRADEILESAGVDPQGSTGSYVDFVASNYQYVDQAAYDLGLIEGPETGQNTIQL